MVYGGIIVDAADVPGIESAASEWRTLHGMFAELKWKKVSAQKTPEYQSFVDLAFDLIERDVIHFKSMVVERRRIDYRRYHEGDRELGFHKLYYQFLLHKFGCYAIAGQSLHVNLDRRQSATQSLHVFKNVLNNGIRKKHGLTGSVVRAVEAHDSKSSILFQIADVLMGAVGYHCNGVQDRFTSAQPKKDMAMYIARRAKVVSLAQATRRDHRRFEIWRFRFSGGK